jgi:hypothetical protein
MKSKSGTWLIDPLPPDKLPPVLIDQRRRLQNNERIRPEEADCKDGKQSEINTKKQLK